MPYTCKVCEDDPSSHSFKNIGTIDNVTYYYTCPAKATKYNDVDGIKEHYDGVLSENNNQWIWVFDCNKFTTKHLLEINVGIELAKLISSKFSNSLHSILIINPTWHILVVMKLVTPFLNNHMKSIIKILGRCDMQNLSII
jgi:hypothetical protein